MDFQKVIYENIEKISISQQTYLYIWLTDIVLWSFILYIL